MNEKGNMYALAALKRKRGDMAGEIKRMKDALAYRQKQLEYVDETIRLLDPDFAVEGIPPRRARRQVKLFKHGELARSILDALRRAEGKPITVGAITTDIIAEKGYGEGSRSALLPRVRGNLTYLRGRGQVTKTGDRASARWSLTGSGDGLKFTPPY